MGLTSNQEVNQLTRESLMTALMQLLASQPLDKISVTELTQRAGVSRMAYYRNYASINAILQDLCNQFFVRILTKGEEFIINNQWYNFWQHLFNFLYDNQNDVKIMLGSQQQSTYILAYLNAAFSDNDPDPKARYIARGMIGLAFNVMTEWVQNDFDMPPQELANLCMTFTTQEIEPNQHLTLSDSYKHFTQNN